MITSNTELLAHLYARAFIQVYNNQFSIPIIENIEKAAHELMRHKRVLFFLNISTIEPAEKKRVLHAWSSAMQLPLCINRLTDLLIDSHRGSLCARIFEIIVQLYREQQGIISFMITSAHPLSKGALQSIQAFLACITERSIIYNYARDTRLIAGIRLQSRTFLWEHSVRKQLQTLHAMLIG